MGRLQRKKPADARKKKRQKKDDAGSQNGAAAEPRSASLSVISGKKKPAAGSRRDTGAARLSAGGKSNIVTKSIQFLREVKVELKKVTWPSRKQTVGSTVVVIILVILIAIFLGVADIALSALIRLVLQ